MGGHLRWFQRRGRTGAATIDRQDHWTRSASAEVAPCAAYPASQGPFSARYHKGLLIMRRSTCPNLLLRVTALAVIAITTAGSGRAEPIGLIERYALAEDRESVLAELIPGSEDFYFYHCLHYQVTGQLERAEATLRDWENDPQARGSQLLVGMRDRQRLLTYGTSPDKTIQYLRDRLGVRFDHPAPPVRGQRRYGDALDPQQIDPDRLIDDALRGDKQLTQAGLRRLAERFLADEAAGLPVDLAWLLQQVDGPWIDRLDELVIRQLRSRRPQDRRFGDLAAHHWLTLEQLQRVAAEVPEVADDDQMVSEILLRLRPSDDTDMSQQPEVRRDYLARADAYVRELPPAYNGLKASILYRRLEADLAAGQLDRDRFLRYLQLPRQSPIILPRLMQQSAPAANLRDDYMKLALVPAIIDESPLVRAYLEHFLQEADTSDAFAGLLRPDYLNQVFAETKLLYGQGPPDRWYRLLTPAQQQQLKDRVELTLAPVNPPRHDPDQPSQLTVDVKHVDELVIRIYQINTAAFHRTHDQLVNTDIDLDGLVPTQERRIRYALPPVRRHRESLELPEIEGRGVWVIDLLGGGLRTRALIRRGDLTYTMTQSAAGLQFTILDERRQPVPSAQLWVASQAFTADDRGRIHVPLADEATTRQAVLMDDDLAVPVQFRHPEEQYQLQAGMLIHRQQLLAGRTADLIIRPRLSMSGQPVGEATLQQASVTVTVTDNEGIQSTKRFDDLRLQHGEEAVVQFRVPPRLVSVQATLTGRVPRTSDGEFADVSDTDSWQVNGTWQNASTLDGYLTRDGENWVLEVRGKNGEVVPAAVVTLQLTADVRNQPVEQTLQADQQGRINLGALPGIRSLQYQVSGMNQHSHSLQVNAAEWPERLHQVTGQPLKLALGEANVNVQERFRLLQLRDDRPHSDVSELLKVDGGLLVIADLPAGNFRLLDLAEPRHVSIAVTEGPLLGEVAAGEVRHLQVRRRDPLGIAAIERDASGVTIRLSGEAPLARVHVLAGRYLPIDRPLERLRLSPLGLSARAIRRPDSAYVSDLRLGEEYQYVLRRQYAKKYPGVMLPQPSLLLNPWETETTSNDGQTAAEGQSVPATPAPAGEPSSAAREGAKAEDAIRRIETPSYEFLPDGGIVLSNLVADADGVVHVPVELIGDAPVVQVVVADPATMIQRTVAGPLPEPESRDLRLATPLEADRPLAFERGVLVAAPDKPLDLDALGSVQLQVYASVADLLQLYRTLASDDGLDRFRELGQWHTLDDAARRDAYGRLACHELHVFLKMHDPQFFDRVVRPYLQNKKEKQLVDHWLLDNDLSAWADLWRYDGLNAAEKAVLARRVPEVREAVLREFRERIALADVDPEILRQAIESGLAGRRLESVGKQLGQRLLSEEAAERGVRDLSAAEAFGFDARMGGMGGAAGSARESRFNRDADAQKSKLFLKEQLQRRSGRAGNGQAYYGIVGDFAVPVAGARFFQHLDATKQWAENHWDRVRVADSNADLIPIDPFWLDWASAGDDPQVLSEHLLRPTANRHAALFALAVAGLPLEAGEITLPDEKGQPFAPPHAVAVITKRLMELKPLDGDPSLLVGQRFEPLDTPEPRPGDKTPLQVAPDEFLVQTAYRGQIVITNPTPQPRTIDVLWQIPGGSLPLSGSQATDSRSLHLAPFAVERIEYQFYFPFAGQFIHYPVCVSHDGRVAARGGERTFHVVDEPSTTDDTSWEAVARNAPPQRIAQFLADANLRRIDLMLVAHRMRDSDVYQVVMDALQQARVWQPELWAYALHHRDVPRIKSYLSQQRHLVVAAGPVLHSELLTIEPIERRLYEHLEYAPLVRARIHPLRDQAEILNDRFLVQYRSLMRNLAYQAAPTPAQQLALSYYLLLQNRIEDAMARFEVVNADDTTLRLQRDYLAAYLALHRSDYATAGEIASRYADHPVPRWRQRFAQLASQLQQRGELVSGARLVSGAKDAGQVAAVPSDAADLAVIDRERRQAERAAAEPALQVVVDGDALRISHRNANEATINFYGVDLELLFSKTPFVRDDLARMATVRPARSETIALDQQDGIVTYRLDDALARQTLLVEVQSGAARATALYYGGRLTTYVSEGFGQLQTSDLQTRHPVVGAYVKVYARHHDGAVRFYKDGYTDLRGRFDYASLSTPDLATTQRFAILVIDPERGATVHDIAPPTR